MRSSNVQGFASKVLTLYEEEVRRRRRRFCSAVRLYVHAQFNFYIIFLCNGIHNIPLLSAVTEKRVSVPEAYKINLQFIIIKIRYQILNSKIIIKAIFSKKNISMKNILVRFRILGYKISHVAHSSNKVISVWLFVW